MISPPSPNAGSSPPVPSLEDDHTDPEPFRQAHAPWHDSFQPQNAYQEWRVVEIVALALRLAQCHKQEQAWRQERIARARDHWDGDRAAEVQQQAEGLPKKAPRVVAQLKQSLHGVN